MKKIILFTKISSLQKHWDNALVGQYNRIHISEEKELLRYLKLHHHTISILLDELSVKNIETMLDTLKNFTYAKVLLFNSIPEVHHTLRLLSKKINGYENSYLNKINLLNMIKSIENGNDWFFRDLTNYIINKFIKENSKKEPSFMQDLTLKEYEIALMVADGFTNKEIAKTEKLALSTIKGHLHNIFEKAGVSDRVSLILMFR